MSRLYGSYRASSTTSTTSMKRRDSSDSSPSQLSSSQSPSNRGSLSSSAILNHFSKLSTSIQRRLSGGLNSSPSTPPVDDERAYIHDFEPSLAPVQLRGFSETTTERVLTEKLAEEIRLMMPTRLQVLENWDLVYSLDQHGVSLSTLYARCKSLNSPQAGFVVIVRDRRDNIFGAYLSDYPHVHPHYYGTGECFLFKFSLCPHHSASHINLSAGSTPATSQVLRSTTYPAIHVHSQSSLEASETFSFSSGNEPGWPASSGSHDTTSQHYRFKGFSYTGLNDYMILCTPQFFSVGGGYLAL